MLYIYIEIKVQKDKNESKSDDFSHIKNSILQKEIIDITRLVPKIRIFHALDRECRFEIKFCSLFFLLRLYHLQEAVFRLFLFYNNNRATEWRAIKVKIQTHDDYPKTPIIFELESDTLSEKIMKKFRKGITKQINDAIKKNSSIDEQAHIFIIINGLHEIIHKNLMCVAYDEMGKIKKMFEKYENIDKDKDNTDKDKGKNKHKSKNKNESDKEEKKNNSEYYWTAKFNEGKGTVKIKMKNNDYDTNITLFVPPNYPIEPAYFEITKCSFPERYINYFSPQAKNIVTKLALGFDMDYITNRKMIHKKDVSEFYKVV